ncbi:MAG: PKD domain-containing protein [Thermoplasmata archaeon]
MPTSINFQWSTVTDLSGITRYGLQLDGTMIAYPTTNSYIGTASSGSHTWRVQAEDGAGNWGAWSGTVSYYVSQYGVCGTVKTYTGDIPISGATVTLQGGSSVTTATNGYWEMQLGAGFYYFTASKSGYYPQTKSVGVPVNGIATLNFALSPIPSDDDGDEGCFAAGTLIATPEGDVCIENVREGDMVVSYNTTTEQVEPNMVWHTTVHEDYLGYLLVNGRLRVTENHPVYTTEGIVAAGDLRVGDVLLTLAGTETVTDIAEMHVLATVYNFEVEANHNYFADGILVHNKGGGGGGDSCPFVYTWDGSYFQAENNILPFSANPDRSQLDVDDYYLFQNDMQQLNGSYWVRLFEPAKERTHLDDIRLAIIDYDNPEIWMAMTPDGAIKTITDPQGPQSCVNGTGGDVLEPVVEMNDFYHLVAGHNETLTLVFPDAGELQEAKLVIRHMAIDPSPHRPIHLPPHIAPINQPYDVPLDPRQYKCSIHVQTMDEQGEWQDFATIPARMNWVLDCIDVTQLGGKLSAGEPLRLLITGTHVIDFIGLDTGDNDELDIEYVEPEFAAHIDDSSGLDISDLLRECDRKYATISPGRGIDIMFPYKEQASQYRRFALISHGHYYYLPEIGISQPVTVDIEVPSGIAEGYLHVFLEEVTVNSEPMILQGVSIDLSTYPSGNLQLMFDRDPVAAYQLRAWIGGSAQPFALQMSFSSFRGSKQVETIFSPQNSILPLTDILWNVTGAGFNTFSGQYEVLKDSPIRFGLTEYYHYEISETANYGWAFGDDSWAIDDMPTHSYGQPGTYLLNLTILNAAADGRYFYSSARINVVESPPIPVIGIFREVEITTAITGRKGNTAGIRIYENEILIRSADAARTAGQPNAVTISLDKYLDRNYRIELVYDAKSDGANPTWLEFKSGETVMVFFLEFNTDYGYYQIVPVPDSYLEDTTTNNPAFRFDASGSYDIDGCIVSYGWDFGDGSIAQGIAVEHTYSVAGTYEVMLTVTDDDGAVAKETVFVEVR